MNKPKINQIYKHYKGNKYRVLHFAKHSETEEILVIYARATIIKPKDLSTFPRVKSFGQIYARPLSMWFELVNGVQRFTEYNP